MKIAVITVSDRAHRGVYEDRSGIRIAEIVRERFPGAEILHTVVPDEPPELLAALRRYQDADFILTTGGTGISPRDRTPEVCQEFCEKPLPGIAEILRAESYRETPAAMLSRGYAGLKGKTLVINFPGSVRAVELCTRLVLPVLEHAPEMLAGKGHGPQDLPPATRL